MANLSILGAGGHGKVTAEIAELSGYDDIVFFDDIWPDRHKNGRWEIVGQIDAVSSNSIFCATGSNLLRERFFNRYAVNKSPTLIHPSAIVSNSAQLGEGCLIVAGAIVNIDAVIGKGVILNSGCSVDHDCALDDFAHISPGARLAGGVLVGARSWIGIGAVVREGTRIGKDVIVGAGAVVLNDIVDGKVVAGIPAKEI